MQQRQENQVGPPAAWGSVPQAGQLPSAPEAICQRCVPELADGCAIDLLIDGTLRRHGVAHRDVGLRVILQLLGEIRPPTWRERSAIGAALSSNAPMFRNVLTPADAVDAACSQEHLQLLRKLGAGSVLVLPLTPPQSTGLPPFGTLTWVRSQGGPRYTSDHLSWAAAFAGQVALALTA